MKIRNLIATGAIGLLSVTGMAACQPGSAFTMDNMHYITTADFKAKKPTADVHSCSVSNMRMTTGDRTMVDYTCMAVWNDAAGKPRLLHYETGVTYAAEGGAYGRVVDKLIVQ